MVRLAIALPLSISLAACYRPAPSPGAPCGPDRSCPDPLVCSAATSTCERTDDPGHDAATDTGDAVNPLDAHLHASSGYAIRALYDLSGAVPYKADDYTDGTTTHGVYDNAPNALAALHPPFTGAFAVTAGRAIIEVSPAGALTVHDYRPDVPDMAGPDNLRRLAFGSLPDAGPVVWGASGSVLGGDGLYTFDASWTLARDNALNNVTGVAFDPAGAYDGIGAAALYFIDQSNIERRDTSTTRTAISPTTSDHYDLALTSDAMYSVFYPSDDTAQLIRVAPTTHATTLIESATRFDLAEGLAGARDVYAIRDSKELVVYFPDGSSFVAATTTDPDWHWRSATFVAPPHAQAGSIVIVESNRVSNLDRLIAVEPLTGF